MASPIVDAQPAVAPLHLPWYIGVGNAFANRLLRLGVPMGPNWLLTVTGRKSGEPRTTPIAIVERDGERYVQSPFGITQWCRNLRAAGEATIQRGRHREHVHVAELPPVEGGPVLRSLVARPAGPLERMAASWFPIDADAPEAAWVELAASHPVFRIVESTAT